MARPVKLRCVARWPSVSFFKPVGVPLNILQRVQLSVEEMEAIRLKDLEGLGQEECAERMRISRATFHRVLESGRGKVADALINGRAIQIEGGNFGLPQQRFRCNEDGHEWEVPFEVMARGGPLACPMCFSGNVQPAPLPPSGFGGRGRGRKFHGGRW
ncbi:MAG: DUF134 domain-containing protein [Dehalococcoidia bacterium]|nr:DUF134 domain-containing protein [Dehalococcoidia bacterium]